MLEDIDKRVLVLAFARATDSVANSLLIVVLPLYIGSAGVSLDGLVGQQLFGITLQEEFFIGLVLSLLGLVSSLGQPITGRLSDMYQKRRVFILVGLTILLISSGMYPFVDSYAAVVVTRAFQGIGGALIVPPTVALVSEYANAASDRGENFGAFNTFRLLGFGSGPLIGGAVAQYGPYATPLGQISGLNAAFSIAVFGAFIGFSLVGLLVSDPTELDISTDDETESGFSFTDPNGKAFINPLLVLGFGTFILAAAISMFAPLEEPIRNRLNQGSFVFSLQFSIGIFAQVLFQIPAGKLSDRYGRRPLIIGGFVILFVAMVGQAVAVTPIQMFISRLLVGVSIAAVFAPGLALAGDLAAKTQAGFSLSILTGAFGLGVAVGPVLSGFLFNLGGYTTPFWVGSVGAVVAFVVSYQGVYDARENTDM